VPQGPTGGLGVVGNLLQQLWLLWLGVANDVFNGMDTSNLVVLPCRPQSAV
jgi:hypothetical protein